jgi:hypothetical protein
VEVHDWRQVELLAGDIELSYVSRPLLVHALGVELALELVWCHASGLAFVGTVFLRPDQRFQSHLDHQPLDCLVIDRLSTPPDRSRHPTIAVTPLVFLEDRSNRHLQCHMPVARRQHLLLVIECAACQARKRKQPVERMEWP